jgi:hypothetical protein
MPRLIWSRPGNPGRAVSEALGIERWQLRNALHRIKEDAGLAGADRVTIWDDGTVTDIQGELIGNIHDRIRG